MNAEHPAQKPPQPQPPSPPQSPPQTQPQPQSQPRSRQQPVQLSPLAVAARFIALSGLGWLCDMATFTLLVKLAGWDAAAANIASSYAGVTFVWFTSLKTVFGRAGGGRFLLIYWGYQFVSILAYSHALGLLASALTTLPQALEWPQWVQWSHWESYRAPAAKLLITPFNLVTNFLFMKALTGRMRPR